MTRRCVRVGLYVGYFLNPWVIQGSKVRTYIDEVASD